MTPLQLSHKVDPFGCNFPKYSELARYLDNFTHLNDSDDLPKVGKISTTKVLYLGPNTCKTHFRVVKYDSM